MADLLNSYSNLGVSRLAGVGFLIRLPWGCLGIMIFMMADGPRAGLAQRLAVERGLSIQQSATFFTVYGITIAVSSWVSCVL